MTDADKRMEAVVHLFETQAEHLIRQAALHGVVVRINTAPLPNKPLAMGNIYMKVEVWVDKYHRSTVETHAEKVRK